MKIFCVLICLILSGSAEAADAEQASLRLNKNRVALCESRDSNSDEDCYDPVSYLTNHKAEKAGSGAKLNRYSFGGATYVFANADHQKLFVANPAAYLPAFGGWCAYAVAAKQEKVDIDPKSFRVQGGRLLVFYDGFLSDTRDSWIKDDKKRPGAFLKEADANWAIVKGKDPQ